MATEKKKTTKSAPKKKAAAAKQPKKEKKPVEKKPEQDVQDTTWSNVIIWTVVIIVVISLSVAVYLNMDKGTQGPQRTVLASVNGEPIYVDDIDDQISRLPPEVRAQATQEQVLAQSIDKTVVLQYAEQNNIVVTDQEIDERLNEQVAQFGISVEQLETLLLEQSYTIEKYRKDLGELIILNKLIEQVIMPQVAVSEDDISSYYQENIDQYAGAPGQSRIRHVLVETEDEAFAVLDAFFDGEEFDDLARQYSIGPSGPSGGDLGFVDESTAFVSPFKEVALELEVGDISDPVETEFGWHVIFRDQDTIPLSEVRDAITELLRQDGARVAFETFIEDLRSGADIVYS